jgi:hypothetical protein
MLMLAERAVCQHLRFSIEHQSLKYMPYECSAICPNSFCASLILDIGSNLFGAVFVSVRPHILQDLQCTWSDDGPDRIAMTPITLLLPPRK